MNSPQTVDQLIEKGIGILNSGQFVEAASLFKQVLSIAPNNYHALRFLGISAGRQGDYGTAANWLIEAIRINPNSARSYCDLGTACFKIGSPEDALAAFKVAAKLQPEFPEAYLNLGTLYFALGVTQEASECFAKALSQNPKLSEAQTNLDRLRSEDIRTRQFIESLQAEIAGEPPSETHPPSENISLPRRELLPQVLNKLALVGTGVEVGVQEGNYSRVLLMNWKGSLLYSIDPWREFHGTDYVDVANISQADQDLCYRTTIKRLAPFQRRSVIWRLTSLEAAELTPDGSLDFCYLDADHSYKGVCEDIRLWYPKVKPAGILAGHDYVPDGTYATGEFGVKGAVDEFVRSHNLKLFLTSEPDSDYLSWMVVKK